MGLTKITEKGIKDGEIINADINASAAIAGSKISPDFGSQNIVTTGSISGAAGTFTGDLTIPDKIVHTGDTDTAIRLGIDTVTAETAGSERIRIDSSGKVGIGTTSPSTNLHVKGPDGSAPKITLSEGTSESAIRSTASGTSSDLRFMTSVSGTQTTKMMVDYSGNVGIGTTSPTGSLSVASGSFQSTTPTSTGDDIVISGNQSLGIQFLTLASGSSNNNIYFGDTDDPDIGMIRYAHADNSLQFQTNTSEAMRVDSSGRVIIGSTGSIGNTYTDNFTISEAAGNAGMQIEGNNSNSNYGSIYIGDAGHRQRSFLETQLGTNGHFTIGTIGNGPIRFTNSSGERVRVTTSGLAFNGDSAAANSLDDYEEGNWTPTVGNGVSGVSYTTQTGHYEKVGKIVHVTWYLRFTGTGDGGAFTIGSLPFTTANTSTYNSGGTVDYLNASFQSGADHRIYIGNNSTVLYFYQNSSGSSSPGTSKITTSGGTDNAIYGSATYRSG